MLTSLLWALPAGAVTSGQLAPSFELPGRAAVIRLNALRGKLVYLDFWASWCIPCRQSFPWMNQMQERYGASGLQIIAVNVDQKPDDAVAFLQVNPARFDIAFDPQGTVPKIYSIKGMPTSVLIGTDGNVLHVHSGFQLDQRDLLEQRLRQALPAGR